MPKKTSKVGTEARRVPLDVKRLVLHEAGYKCSNPACRYPLTLDVHHLYYVSEGGSNVADNLLPLCPNCHTEHHNGNIPTESLRAWKMLLMALNEAFDRRSIDILLTIARLERQRIANVSGDGVPTYAPLIAANLISIWWQPKTDIYTMKLTNKGRLFVEGWKKGDQRAAIEVASADRSTKDDKEKAHAN